MADVEAVTVLLAFVVLALSLFVGSGPGDRSPIPHFEAGRWAASDRPVPPVLEAAIPAERSVAAKLRDGAAAGSPGSGLDLRPTPVALEAPPVAGPSSGGLGQATARGPPASPAIRPGFLPAA